jgi:putative dimethyl sulfoxide reductase chaperone
MTLKCFCVILKTEEMTKSKENFKVEETNKEMWKTALMGETLSLSMLGKTLYEDPNNEWLNSLIKENIFSDVPFGENHSEVKQGLKLLQDWTQRNSSGLSTAEFEAIRKDHLYLFTGVGKPLASVWESTYFSEGKLLFQKQTLEVREFYARFGLQAERKGHEPDDHIGLELSFLAHLATLALNSLEAGDESHVEDALQAQRDFLTQHILRWAPAWAELTEKHAETDFYHGLAHLTVGTLWAASELLGIEIPKEETK